MWRADIPPSRKADIDVDYASDRRQEIKDYLEERYNADGRITNLSTRPMVPASSVSISRTY